MDPDDLVPDDPSELFKDPASENMTGAMESLSAALPEDLLLVPVNYIVNYQMLIYLTRIKQ